MRRVFPSIIALGWFCVGLHLACVTMAPVHADEFWDHKDWRAFAADGQQGQLECMAMTGGDGDDSLRLTVAKGGDLGLHYAEATARGIRPALREGDALRVVIDGVKEAQFEDVAVRVGVDQEGIPYARADIVGGDVASAIGAMRAGNTLVVEREKRDGPGFVVIGRFSLSGFTATYLQLSEWCRFKP